MFPELETAVDTVEIPLERDAIVAAIGLRDRWDAKISTAVGGYQALGLHEVDGSVTMGSWLRHWAKLDSTTAIRSARRAAKLHQLPVLREAFLSGVLSGGAVDIVLHQVINRHLDLFAEHETELVPRLALLDIDGVTTVMREWRAKADALNPGPEPVEVPDTVHLAPTLDDRGVLNGSLGSDLYNLLFTVLRVADPGDLSLPMAQRRALALGQVCQSFLDFNPNTRHRRHRPHLNITMTYEQWADREHGTAATYLDTGMPVSRYGLDTLRCDAAWPRLTHQERASGL